MRQRQARLRFTLMGALDRLHRSTPAELKARLAAERTGVPFIVLRDDRDCQQIVELTPARSPLTLGRQPASDIALTWDDEVSRAHAAIECIGDVWTLVDDGRSRNGSFVNGKRVHGRRALRPGDVLAIGQTTLTYVAPARRGRSAPLQRSDRQETPRRSALLSGVSSSSSAARSAMEASRSRRRTASSPRRCH